MEQKVQRLVLALQGIALVTALVLILVDYKLKNDLVDLYKKMEDALARGQKLFGQNVDTGSDTGDVRSSHLVGAGSGLETPASPSVAEQNGQPETNGRASAKRSRRAGDKAVSDADKQVGS